jgi:hypothetical protein
MSKLRETSRAIEKFLEDTNQRNSRIAVVPDRMYENGEARLREMQDALGLTGSSGRLLWKGIRLAPMSVASAALYTISELYLGHEAGGSE